MPKTIYRVYISFVFFTLMMSCANRGTPSGGERDILPPTITRSTPENMSINFNSKEIRIYFDEYVKIKDVQKQLIISPPMDPEPDITPLGSASKYIKITINDTLAENTTYAFNFGQSIVDNNEENPYPYYRYVFSTGNYIDSLSVKGSISDAEKRVADKFVSVMLYEIDSTYNDSVIYKKKPKYVTNTLDSLTTFSIDNIKAGEYLLVALKDENRNFTFQPKTDKIGFYNQLITVPTDSSYDIKLFKEVLDLKVKRPSQVAGQKLAFGYEGDAKGLQIEMLGELPEDFEQRITKDKKTDTLYYWYKPKLELDSTYFVVKNQKYRDTLFHRFRDQKQDTLTITNATGSNVFSENFKLEGSIPFVKFEESNISIMDKDSLTIPFTTFFDELSNTYSLKFEKKEANSYKIQLLPESITDFFGNVNDTLNYTVRTKEYSAYSNVRVTLKNAAYPVIVQLTDANGAVKYEQFATEPKLFDFRYINTGEYYLRVIFDTNGNQKWDTGSFLNRIQPERISYDSELIDARANFDTIVEFILK